MNFFLYFFTFQENKFLSTKVMIGVYGKDRYSQIHRYS